MNPLVAVVARWRRVFARLNHVLNKFNRIMSERDSRSDARDRYQAVVRAVRENRCGPVPELTARRQVVLALAAHGQYSPDGVRSSCQAAVDHDDLLCVRRDGRRCYAVVEEARLLDAIEAASACDDVDQALVAQCNDHLDAVREGS